MEEMKITFDRSAALGEGGYGTVFKGEFEGRQVAVKRVLLSKFNKNEEEFLRKLDHPNIIKLYHSESDNDFRIYALELCDASLDQLFFESRDPRKYNGPMPHHIDVFLQLASGLEYIHSNDLIHRDIKPENVLISVPSTDRGDEVTIKWAGFGLSKTVNERGTCTLSGIKGTKNWLAPESLKWLNNAQKVGELRGTVQSDVFVLGLVFGYLLLKGEHLYGTKEDVEQNIRKKNPVNMQKIDGKLRQIYEDHLLTKMLEDDPSKRITSKEVVKQLNVIKKTLDEEELFRLCASDSSSGLTKKINDLIQRGTDVNAKDKLGRNALHVLCWFNSSSNLIDAIRLLIQLGIDVNAKDDLFGENALHCVCRDNSNPNLIDAIQLLIQLGIDVNAKNIHGKNAFHALCQNKSYSNIIDAIRLLIQLGIDFNAKDNYGKNALHFMCIYNSSSNLIDAIQLLIQLGIPVVSDGKDARSFLRWNYKIRNKEEILKLLDEAAPVGILTRLWAMIRLH